MDKEKCKGCSVLGDPMTINGPIPCELKPSFNSNECPCLICLVKATCTVDDHECEKYYEFAKQQFPKVKTKEEDIPCKTCNKFDSCVDKIKQLIKRQYGDPPEFVDCEEPMHFHTDLMCMLTRDCEILSAYFPYDVVSRDGLMAQPSSYSKHHKASQRLNMDENEWYRRNEELYYFFLDYSVKSTEDC